MKKNLVVSCCVVALLGVVACSGSDGGQGTQGANGSDGQSGSTGATGATGSAGANGSNGAPGSAGANGAAGAQGDAGAAGATGATGSAGSTGDQGEQGSTGANGDIACGSDLIAAADWHTACDVHSNPGWDSNGKAVCLTGQVQCRGHLSDGDSGELVLAKVCYGSADAQTASSRCDEDLNCDGNADDTTNAGTNVALVRPALTYECPVGASNTNLCDSTFLKGYCRNAVEHCLGTNTCLDLRTSGGLVRVSCDGLGNPEQTFVSGNREGVTLADYGDLTVATADESKMGYECVSGSDVKTWDCTVDATGVASVTCTGPRGL